MDFKRHFTKEDMQIINKQMIHSTCHNEMQIKTAMRYNCIPVRTAKIQNICTTKSGEVVEQQEFSYMLAEVQQGINIVENKQFGSFKKLITHICHTSTQT